MAEMTDVEQAKEHLLRGRAYIGEKAGEENLDSAIMEFKAALLLDPDLTDARDYLARCFHDSGLRYANNGDDNSAIAEYAKAIGIAKSLDDFPKDLLSAMYFNYGASYSRKSAWKTAQFYFGEAKELNPADEECQQAYMKAQYNRVNHKEFNCTMPSSNGDYAKRGAQYLKKGDYDNAIANFNDAIILYPKYATDKYVADYENRGEAYIGKGDYDKAIADFTTAISISPSYNAYTQRGNAYEAKKDHDKAIADFTGAINISPKSYDAYKKRGAVYEAKGDHDKAKADFAQAEQLQKKATKRSRIIGLVIAAIIVGLIIKCAVG
jgi:tetratricopeptide (TPR) repeat protein